MEKREPTDITQTVAWRERRLVFTKEALADIAEEFNRYNRAPQIRVEGDIARNTRYTGVFDV